MTAVLAILPLQAASSPASSQAPAPSSAASIELAGSASDPAEDTHFYFGDEPPPDLHSASVSLSSESGVAASARFGKGRFSKTTTAVHFSFYRQRPAAPSACGDYLVDFNVAGTPRGAVRVRRRTSAGGLQDVGSGVVRFVRDGVELTILPAVFGDDLRGLAYWHVVVAVRLRDDAESRILDYLPDTDLPLATVRPSRGRRTKR